jgi:phosphoribosylamine--glycine ligase
LINVGGEPYVIEYNARLGDPESEVIIPRIKSDIFELIEGVAKEDLANRVLEIDERFATTVMLVSGGYPDEFEKGKTVHGLDLIKGSMVFHAGTKSVEDKVVTSGGRVLAVTSWGATMKDALATAYKNAELLKFEGICYRKDIGFDL